MGGAGSVLEHLAEQDSFQGMGADVAAADPVQVGIAGDNQGNSSEFASGGAQLLGESADGGNGHALRRFFAPRHRLGFRRHKGHDGTVIGLAGFGHMRIVEQNFAAEEETGVGPRAREGDSDGATRFDAESDGCKMRGARGGHAG